jgi:hypothetical protein
MFLAIRNGLVIERSEDEKSLLKLDPALYEVVEWDDPLPPYDPGLGESQLDPRTPAQKTADVHTRYKRKRLREYPSIRKQLDMMYHDAINGTTTWVDEITRIKKKFPKVIRRDGVSLVSLTDDASVEKISS